MTQPLISVIMPAYNAQAYISEAIQSILDQTYSHFELIIVNDGSTDATENIIFSYSDPRIRYIKNEKNVKLSATLNRGLDEARGEYIARMDADDLSHPKRLEKQLAFLQKHPDYGVVGSMYVILDEQRKPYEMGGMDYRTNEEIQIALLSNNVFAHGETMIRASLIQKHHLRYNPLYNPCEDYDLWVRMSEFTKFHILEDVLYSYMINPQSMSGTRWKEMNRMIVRIARELQKKRGLPYVSWQQFLEFYNSGRKKLDGVFEYHGYTLPRYHKVNYQEFLYRTAFVYLRLLNLQGFQFLAVSFLINPVNWVWKLYRLFFYTHPRLRKQKKEYTKQ